MGIRPYCLCLYLFAALGASGAPLAADPPHGVLVPSSSAVSTILIDADALSSSICDELPNAPLGPGNLVKCTVKVLNDTPTVPVPVLLIKPVMTPCGPWDAELTFDLIPLTSPAPAARALAMSTLLHLKNRETGQTAEIRMRLGTGLADPPETSAGASSGKGRQLFFGNRGDGNGMVAEFAGCIPKSFIDQSPDFRIVEEDKCSVCPPEDSCPEYGPNGQCDGQ